MLRYAIIMLTADTVKFLALVAGVTFAALLMTQQAAIYLGFVNRMGSFIDDTAVADIWVMDPDAAYADDIKRMLPSVLERVRSVPGVAWAMPMYRGFHAMRLPDGRMVSISLTGVDDATLVGAPGRMRVGGPDALRPQDAIVVDQRDVEGQLRVGDRPLAVGDEVSIGEVRARIGGVAELSTSFFWFPVVYTTWSRAMAMAPPTRRTLNYVLVRASPGEDHGALSARIGQATGQKALTTQAFRATNEGFINAKTGIAVNFGIAIALGAIVGLAVSAQTFFQFVHDHVRHFAALRAMGASNGLLVRMLLLQAGVVGAIGYGVGAGAAALFGTLAAGTELAFLLDGRLLIAGALATVAIVAVAAVIGVRTVLTTDPALVFRS